MGDGIEKIHSKIRSFQKKYYLNIFIKGAILTLSIAFVYFLLVAVLEHAFWLDSWMRLVIFVSFFAVVAYCIYKFLKEPLQWWVARQGMAEEQSAKMIGDYMPGVKDRLVNLLQLTSYQQSTLARESIRQRSAEFEPLAFDSVIDLSQNKRFLKYLLLPLGIILIILFINQRIITDSTKRIIHFSEEYSPQAPFNFNIRNKSLIAFYNEDFNLQVELTGSALPEDIYLLSGANRFKLEENARNSFSYTFENIQNPVSFQLEGAGFYSQRFDIQVVNRPELTGFNVELAYPQYIKRKNDLLKNAGNLEIPEGTVVTWNISTSHANSAKIDFTSDQSSFFDFQNLDNQSFIYSKSFKNPDQYEIVLQNDQSENRDRITYGIDVVKDQFPQISVNNLKDSILYKHIMLGGIISDDYGLTQLMLHYRITDENRKTIQEKNINIPVAKDQLQQSYLYNWSLDSIQLKAGYQLEYYLKVWDNDGVNGRKATNSANFNFFIPGNDKLIADINKSSEQTEQQIDKSVSKANNLQDQIEQAAQRMKGKQSMDWQDKKMLEDILQQKQNLDKLINQFKDQNKLLNEKKDAFTEQDERIKEKAEQIQKLMNELLDEETKKLFEELQKLMKENSDVSQIQKLLDKLNQNTSNLEKELDRMLELFKQLEYDTKFDQTLQKLNNEVDKQKDLLEKTESLEKQENKNADKKGDRSDDKKNNKADQKDQQNKDSKENKDNASQDKNNQDTKDNKNGDKKENSQDLAKEQEQLKEDFKETSEEMEELRKMGEELKNNDDLPEEENSNEIMEDQQNSQDQLQQNSPSNAKKSQQKALDKMKQMQRQMQGSQNSMSMEMDMANLEALRQILHGLIKLSFDQENLMKGFNDLQTSDPRFNELAAKQLTLRDNASVLEDSLRALSKRDAFMSSIVTKEITELNEHMDKATEANRERRRAQAQGEMQLSMTSINNLALMLDSHYDMMMQMMANAKPSMKGKSKQKGKQPNLSQLQQQLNNRIQELKGSGKSGRQLSEELSQMAAEQERIRKAMQEMQEKLKKEGGQTPGGDLPTKMEQTEMDLVNKQLTDQLIKRQQDILTRLLEAEKSMREQDQDDERKGETAKDYEKEIPKAFEEYLRLKEKEVELLKTVPPKLYPYYKKEVDEYFKRIGDQ